MQAGLYARLATLGLLGCLPAAGPAQAQSYPTRPITIVVPAAPGGVSDTMARLVAQRFMTAWGQQVIVENRGGANHAIGAAMVGKAAPDGHSMMVAAETVFVINPTLHAGKLPYHVNDFAPITGLVRINQGLLANPSLPATGRRAPWLGTLRRRSASRWPECGPPCVPESAAAIGRLPYHRHPDAAWPSTGPQAIRPARAVLLHRGNAQPDR